MDILQEYLDRQAYLIAPRSIANDTVLHQEWFHRLNLVFFIFVEHQEQKEQQEHQRYQGNQEQTKSKNQVTNKQTDKLVTAENYK